MARGIAGTFRSTLVKCVLRRAWTLGFILSTAMLAIAPLLSAQSSPARFDRQVQAYVRNGDFSGSVLVARQGHIVFQKSYGMAN